MSAVWAAPKSLSLTVLNRTGHLSQQVEEWADVSNGSSFTTWYIRFLNTSIFLFPGRQPLLPLVCVYCKRKLMVVMIRAISVSVSSEIQPNFIYTMKKCLKKKPIHCTYWRSQQYRSFFAENIPIRDRIWLRIMGGVPVSFMLRLVKNTCTHACICRPCGKILPRFVPFGSFPRWFRIALSSIDNVIDIQQNTVRFELPNFEKIGTPNLSHRGFTWRVPRRGAAIASTCSTSVRTSTFARLLNFLP